MSWFSKKCKCEKKKEYVTKYRDKEYNIGKTSVKLHFKDGNEFITNIYGIYYPNITKDIIIIDNSLFMATRLITNKLYFSEGRVYIDDQFNLKCSVFGTLTKAEILETVDYNIMGQESYLVKKET